jgi:omega-6 fatty acid desaturase (delta-12 desaturase)
VPISDVQPRRVEFLTHDISVHVPHHVNSKIPWYNLRKAHASLQQNWGQVRRTCSASHSRFAAFFMS